MKDIFDKMRERKKRRDAITSEHLKKQFGDYDEHLKNIRLAGDGTVYNERCTYHKRCAYETNICDQNTCHFASQFYKGVRD